MTLQSVEFQLEEKRFRQGIDWR